MSHTRSLFTTTALLVLATLGCGDATAPVKPETPRFDATVTGPAALHLTGGAVFDDDVPGFGLALVQAAAHAGEDTVQHAVYFRIRTPGMPAPGEYSVVSGNYEGVAAEAGVVLDGDSDDPLLCVGTGGLLVVEKIVNDRLSGHFTFGASCSHVGGDPLDTRLTVTGTFVAARGSLSLPE